MAITYAAAGIGASLGGPAGVLIPLGIELVLSDLTQITFYYNLWSVFIIMLLAVTASQRDTRFIALLLPLWAGLCMLVGWLKYPNPGTGFAVLIVCAAIAIMTYMQETVHERFGIAGPGNKIVKIFMGLMILQCVVVFVNSAAIFPVDGPISESNEQYTNIQLQSNFDSINGAGGLTAPAVDVLSITIQMALSMLLMFIKCLLSIALFSVVLAQVFPWIVQAGAVGIAFLVLLQFAIWGMYMLFVFTLFYKPSLDPGW